MKLIFEKSVPGRRCTILPACDVESVSLPASLRRETKPTLPEMSETPCLRRRIDGACGRCWTPRRSTSARSRA